VPPVIVPPGHIVFSSLQLGADAPAIAPPAPVIVPPLPAGLKFDLADALRPPAPGSITFAAFAVPTSAPEIAAPERAAVALLDLKPVNPTPEALPALDQPVPQPVLVGARDTCPVPAAVTTATIADVTPDRFGVTLAAAALAQTESFVIYDARYTRIAFPAGDVPSLYGVCTDVIIRAYRALGIDLQAQLQQSRLRGGDTSIDHRRTETLRRFFDVYGERVAITPFAEDYLPGDIVTYYRPQNKSSTSHIAIVSDRIAPSGRPMIIHNRGHGVQLEDGLFVDRITGHYRYAATVAAPVTANVLIGPAVTAAQRMAALVVPTLVDSGRLPRSPATTRLALRLTGSSIRSPMTALPR
jgi:uncharacterized protein YijF (DUF1287 family)